MKSVPSSKKYDGCDHDNSASSVSREALQITHLGNAIAEFLIIAGVEVQVIMAVGFGHGDVLMGYAKVWGGYIRRVMDGKRSSRYRVLFLNGSDIVRSGVQVQASGLVAIVVNPLHRGICRVDPL